MRIAVYHNLLSGGAKRALAELARRLAARHELDVYTLSSGNQEFADLRPFVAAHRVFPFAPLPLLGSPFGRLNQATRTADLLRLGHLNKQIAAEIEQHDYDVVFVHPCQYETSPSLLAHLRDVPAVYYCQEPLRRVYEPQQLRPYDLPQSRRRQLLDRIDPLIRLYYSVLSRRDRRNTRRAGRVLVNSQFMRDAVGRIYGREAEVSYLGVDSDLFRPLPVEKRGYVLSVGSLTPLKGFDFLIEALGHITEPQRPPLVIVSNFQNPPERAYLEHLAEAAEVELRLLSEVSDERLVQLYNEAALVAYAAVREPFGLVPLEAMACGTPVVAVREGGVRETIVHEETGLLVERKAGRFAQAVLRLLEDGQLANEYGRRGREVVLRRWTWEEAARRAESHLLAMQTPRTESENARQQDIVWIN
ncbi:MAG: glycosyltransferase family 4 protein [Anaerolineae bacterium]|nr:glycosyltransferase family 4 protein [Anaerolineae bacterium]